MSRSFTLIELLIVVAIIAILAAIAVPNFLEAQTRARVTRAASDLRTLATGLEAYHVDHNDYPYISDDDAGEWIMPLGHPANRLTPGGLTSPVAYLTAALYDPFVMDARAGGAEHLPDGPQFLHYERAGFGFDGQGRPYNDDGSWRRAVHVPPDAHGSIYGTYAPEGPDTDETTDPSVVPTAYVLFSIGPDRTHRIYYPDGKTILTKSRWSIYNYYDPTNGTISDGNIVRFPGGKSFP
ncbi:prepilin-type N-terminal cleavage/methylation domain-containing protein [bacterium]|nr:prepilin-type N-terminal cleavage/methylation domain-containing protein [bacterium]